MLLLAVVNSFVLCQTNILVTFKIDFIEYYNLFSTRSVSLNIVHFLLNISVQFQETKTKIKCFIFHCLCELSA